MQFYARRMECKHIVWAGPLVNTAATLQVANDLRGRRCPDCPGGEVVREVDFVTFKMPTSAFDEPPAPRNAENKLKKASSADIETTRKRLTELGAETGGLATVLKDSAIQLTPPEWRSSLAAIPVGLLQKVDPEAECITFKGSALPAIVFHQGLAGYLFALNRSMVPLIRTGTLKGDVTTFVDDEKTRAALRIQAVDTALVFLGIDKPRTNPLVESPLPAKVMEMALTRTMMSFLLCHEYGHAVLNHADQLRTVGRDPSVYLLERSRAMEFEADSWGQDAVTGAFTGGKGFEPALDAMDHLFGPRSTLMKQDISAAVPCLTLLSFEFLDLIRQRLAEHGIHVGAQSAPSPGGRKQEDEPSTHPSNHERFQALNAHLSKHGNFTAHRWVMTFGALFDEIKDDLDALIDKTGVVAGKKLTRRLRWPRGRGKNKPASWRYSEVTELDDDTRHRLQKVLRELERQGLAEQSQPLDQTEVSRHYDELEKRATAHYRKKEYAQAADIYTQILDGGEAPDSIPLYTLLGACREALGDKESAIAAYRRCLEIAPGSEAAALGGFSLGRILRFDRNDPDGAEVALTAAITSNSPDVRLQSMFWLGVIAHDRDEVDAALRWYRMVWAEREAELEICPAVAANAAVNMGNALLHRGQFEEAATLFEYARDHPAIEPENRAIAARLLRTARGR